MSPHLTRRSFLSAAAGTAGAVAAAPLLAACGTSASGGTGATGAAELAKILPTYVAYTPVKPDIPSVNGVPPVYLSYPSNLVRTVSEKPGAGSTITTITPLWASTPPANNQYYQAVNHALGATISIQPANGNTYYQALPPLFAGNKLPDWIDIPAWNNQSVNLGAGIGIKFADLTPYLAGDKIKQYPNLANIPPEAWQAAIWDNKIYGIPSFPTSVSFGGALYYRADILDKLGIGTPDIKTAADLYALGKEINDPKGKRWAFDDLWSFLLQPFNIPPSPPEWTQDAKGNLVAAWETEQMIEAINWEASIFKAGMMNPDAIALDTSNAKQRFYSGQNVITGDGIGAWTASDTLQGRAANPSYLRMAFPPFNAGGGNPGKSYPLSNGATLFSYLNKGLSKSKIKECLRIANYLAAPYGTYEYTLTTWGVPSVDFTMTKYGPAYTTAGNNNVSPTTYPFLASAPNVISVGNGLVDVAKAEASWLRNAAKYAYKPLFYDMNITVPNNLQNALYPPQFTTAVPTLMQSVVRGRNTIADFKDAVKSWQTSGGGNALRKFFESIRAKYGDA